MRPMTPSDRRSPRSLRATALIAALLVVAACDSSVAPSPSPAAPASAAPSLTVQASPSTTPSEQPSPASSPDASAQPQGDFAPGALAVTVSDRLRVRSKPEVDAASVKYQPVLPVGTQLQVLDGPVEGSGYQWVRVAPVGVTLDGGVADGWVAIADHDGTPWIELSEAPLAGLNVAEASVKLQSPSLADARRAASELNAFGISLYKRMLADPQADLGGKGVAMSPTSIAMALAMARAGADGSTASQMDRVLRANGWNDLGSGLGSLQQILNGHNATWKDDEGTSHSLSLNVVNRAFGQDGWPIEQAYLQRIGRAFGAGLGLVDYMRDSSAARDLINGWVARQTANRIPKLLVAGRRDGGHAPRPRERHLPEGELAARVQRGRHPQPPVHDPGRHGSRADHVPARRAGRSPGDGRGLAGDRAPLQRRRRVRPAGDDADPP